MRTSSLVQRLLLLTVLAAALTWGCGGGDKTDTRLADVDTASIEKKFERQINYVMERLRYDDKSAMWENEFEYLHAEMTFDDYLTRKVIAYAAADSVDHVEVKNVDEFKDSALARVVVHFKGLSGRESAISDTIVMYHHDGRWLKPTYSTSSKQLAFDSVRQAAIKAAEREAGA